ncbi:MAG TPA: Gfo/Idh/MocA family oxidoreductase [Terriglobales bacterium]|jgi:predicted dehydrogenase|nr:Gfo/Idh/MocA family oxidoreductase [Terriglobales bacterium]
MVRFGIAGFGLHAVKRLMPGFAKAKRSRVTALSRRSMAAARDSAAEYKIPLGFDSVAAMAASPEVDAVLVTTPNASHLVDVLAAIDAGKHVLCEKPMAMNADECRQMVEAARRRGVVFGVAHVFRFDESVLRFRELLKSGKIGKAIFARSEFSFLADPSHPRKWLYDSAIAGAGPIFDIGVHCIDTLRFVLNDEVTRVSASAASDERSGDVESAASLTLEFSRGTIGTVLVSYRAAYRTPLELVGDSGVIRAEDALNVEHPIEIQLQREGKVVETATVSNQSVYALQVDAFADAVEGKSRFPIPGEEGWQNQEVLDAAMRSLRTGKSENVPRVSL